VGQLDTVELNPRHLNLYPASRAPSLSLTSAFLPTRRRLNTDRAPPRRPLHRPRSVAAASPPNPVLGSPPRWQTSPRRRQHLAAARPPKLVLCHRPSRSSSVAGRPPPQGRPSSARLRVSTSPISVIVLYHIYLYISNGTFLQVLQ
jgi:hypothetical protein